MQSIAAAGGLCLVPAGGRGSSALAAPPPAAILSPPLRCQRPRCLADRGQQLQMVAGSSRSSSTGLLLRQPRPLRPLSSRGSGGGNSSTSSSSSLLLRQRQLHRRGGSSGAVQPRAAADAGAGAAGGASSSPSSPPPPMQQPKRAPREMSLQQRWRAAKFAAKEAAERLSQVPAVAALLAALAALNAKLQPLRDAWELLQKKEEQLMETYNAFLAEETRRQWAWSKRYAKELAWWSRVPPFMGFFLTTLAYQAFMPVSFAAAVAVPLYYSWVLWDDWWASPIFLATLLTAPLKWVPWADKCLVWPGLI